MKQILYLILVLSVFYITNSQILNLSSPQPLDIDQYRRLTTKLPIFDTRQQVPDGLIKNAYWMTSAGKIQQWIAYYINSTDPFLIFTDVGKQGDTIGRFQSVGYTGIVGYNTFSINQWPDQKIIPSIMSGAEVIKQTNRVHLDIRRLDEWQTTGIIQGAILISLPELQQRLGELKDKTNIYVNCGSAIRARLGWSVLARVNISSTVLDEEFSSLAGIGFKIVPYTNELIA